MTTFFIPYSFPSIDILFIAPFGNTTHVLLQQELSHTVLNNVNPIHYLIYKQCKSYPLPHFQDPFHYPTMVILSITPPCTDIQFFPTLWLSSLLSLLSWISYSLPHHGYPIHYPTLHGYLILYHTMVILFITPPCMDILFFTTPWLSASYPLPNPPCMNISPGITYSPYYPTISILLISPP
jgi:hypothetical protein